MNVVKMERPDWENVAATLRLIADQIESGEYSNPKTCVMVTQLESGEMGVIGLGPASDDMRCLALLELGKHWLAGRMLAPD